MPVKPSTPEDTYFARLDWEKKRTLAQAREEQLRSEERRFLKEQHWMHCPKCGMDLIEIDFLGHKVDQCHACQGLWLDAAEVEALARTEDTGFLGSLRRMLWT